MSRLDPIPVMTCDQAHDSIDVRPITVESPLGETCEWCGRPIERGERAWFAENLRADAVGCTKADARSVVFAQTRRIGAWRNG